MNHCMDDHSRRACRFGASGAKVLAVLATLLSVVTDTSRAEELGGPAQTLPFPVGETLNYRVYWGVIPVGSASAVTEWTEEEGRRLIAIRTRARSNRTISRLYRVDSRVESLVDPETRLPVRFTKNLSEGRRRHHEITYFNHASGMARFHDLVKDRRKAFPIEKDTHDLLSFMYFARGETFQPGSTTSYSVMADEKMYELQIEALREEDVPDANGVPIATLLLEPKATFEGLFVRKGKMLLWVSRETPSVIVRANVEVPLARVKAILAPSAEKEDEDD